MEKNLLSSLKEKKSIMKLSLAALAGAMAVYGGAALCSASAVVSPQNIGATTDEISKVEITDEVRKIYEFVSEFIEKGKDRDTIMNGLSLLRNLDEAKIEGICAVAAEKDDIDTVYYIRLREVAKLCEEHEGFCKGDRIVLRNCELDQKSTDVLVKFLKIDQMFKTLFISHSEITLFALQKINEALQINTTLMQLALDGSSLSILEINELRDLLQSNTTLTKLSLFNVDFEGEFGNKKLTQILEGLKKNTTITSLDLGGDKIDDEGARMIAEMLKINTTITKLNLSGDKISPNGARMIGEALKINSTLEELYLSDNMIEAEGVSYLSEALKVNTTLIRLNLQNNGLGDAGVEKIYEALKVNTTLVELEMWSNNNISDRGLNLIWGY